MSEPAGAAIVDVAPKLAGPGAGAAGYSRSLSRLAAFTRWITAPWILLVIASGIAVQILTGTEPFHVLNQAGLEQAGHFGGLVATASMLDGVKSRGLLCHVGGRIHRHIQDVARACRTGTGFGRHLARVRAHQGNHHQLSGDHAWCG